MTKEEAIKMLKYNSNVIHKNINGKTDPKEVEALDMAIESLEAWEKVEKEINDLILICRESAQNNTWCDGELAGFLQSKDIINRNLSEVNE